MKTQKAPGDVADPEVLRDCARNCFQQKMKENMVSVSRRLSTCLWSTYVCSALGDLAPVEGPVRCEGVPHLQPTFEPFELQK